MDLGKPDRLRSRRGYISPLVFFIIPSAWLLKVRVSSMVTPRTFTDCSFTISSPFIVHVVGMVAWWLWILRNNMVVDFFALAIMLWLVHHNVVSSIAACKSLTQLFVVLGVNVKSSAYLTMEADVTDSVSTYSNQNIGPSSVPCGVPFVQGRDWLLELPNLTYCVLIALLDCYI